MDYEAVIRKTPRAWQEKINAKWTKELGDITSEEMNVYNRNLKYVKEIKLRDFQFKINHRILVTNSFLLKIKKKETDLCSYCHTESESIMHLFARCDLVKEFRENFKRWLTDKINTTLEINDKNIFFHFLNILLSLNISARGLFQEKNI